jgi:site-specific DNA recombinase
LRACNPHLDLVVLSIEAKLRRAGKEKRLIIANGANSEINQGLVELIKEAFAIRNQLLSGSDDSIEAFSTRLGMNKFRLTSLVRLSYLAPGIIRALLAASHRADADPALAAEQRPSI